MTSKTSFPIAALAAILLAAPALADNGKSNGNNGGHGNSDKVSHDSKDHSDAKSKKHDASDAETKSDHGALAAELKGLNAVKANPNALEHAAPGSQVGRIAAYRDAALITEQLHRDLTQANLALAALPVPARNIATVDAAIAALDTTAADYPGALAMLQAERAVIVTYRHAVTAAEAAELAVTAAQVTEDAALLTASDGRVLSDAALAYIREVLNL